MPTKEQTDRARKGIKARQDAIKDLIQKNQAEFDAAVEKNRLALGLPARPQGPTADELRERIARGRERLEAWQKELERST